MTISRYPRPAKEAVAYAYNQFGLASFTVGTKSVNTINVAVQLQDVRQNNVSRIVHVKCYLASVVGGGTISPTAPTTTTAIGTNGCIIDAPTGGVVYSLVTNATGQFDLNLVQTAGGTNYWLVIVLPDGGILVSPEISF